MKKLHDPQLMEQIVKLQEEIESMTQRNSSLDVTAKALESQLQEQCEKTKAKQSQIEEAAEKIKALLEDSEVKEQLIKAKELRIETSEQKIKEMQLEIEKLREELENERKNEKEHSPGQGVALGEKEKSEEGVVEKQKGLIEEKDKIIAKHEESVLYYEETIMELKQSLEAKMKEFEVLNQEMMQKQQQFFPTYAEVESKRAESRLQKITENDTEEEGEPVQEIVYIKFDIATLDPDDSEIVKELKQEKVKLEEELDERVELLKRERRALSLIQDRGLELACEIEEKNQQVERLNLALKKQDNDFRKWKKRGDEIESTNRDLDVKLARTEASLKIALQKFNEASHQVQIYVSQLKDQQLQEKILNEKIQFLAQAKHKAESQTDEVQKKVKQATSKINYLENFLFQQKEELNNKEGLLYRMKTQYEEQQSMLKSTELKLRQVSVTKVKDWQKKFKQMEQEKKVLEDMVRTAKFQQQEKEAELKKADKKIKRLEKQMQQKVQSERAEVLSTSPSRKSSEHTKSNDKLRKIKEVEENLESTHKSRNIAARDNGTLPQISKLSTKSRKQSQDFSAQDKIYETPPIKRTQNLLTSPSERKQHTIGTTTPRTLIRRNSRPQSTQRSERGSKVGTENGDGQLESARGPGMNSLMQDTEGISKYSEIRAARLKKASQSPFWSQQLDVQYEDYMQTLSSSSTKNNSVGIRKVLFHGGNESTQPLIMRSNYLQRFKPS